MIRKAIIVVLTLAALGTSFLWALSYWTPVTWQSRSLPDIPPANDTAEGRSPLAFEIELRNGRVSAGNLYTQCGSNRYWQFKFTGIKFVSLVEKREYLVDKLAFIAPFWTAPVLLIIHPAITFIRGPLRRWRRHRKGLCLKCGYNLTGLSESRCPECGTEFER